MPVRPEAYLAENLFGEVERKPTRDGYGTGLVKAGKENPNVVALCADLTESTRTETFKKEFPDRFVEIGVAEQLLATVAAGMALEGKVPYIASYAGFSPGRNWEQIRTTAALNDANVKICGAHAGVSVGPDGATHQMLEDIAIMRVMPNMRVFAPCDALEAEKATHAVSKIHGPCYLRFAREKTPLFTTEKTPFEIGKAQLFWVEPKDKKPEVAIIACGPLVYEALKAANALEAEGVSARVLNAASVKPFDAESVIQAAKDAGAVVTVEEAQYGGGLGGTVCEVVSESYPVPIKRIGMKDRFGESGEPDELIEHFALTAPHIAKAAKAAIAMKER